MINKVNSISTSFTAQGRRNVTATKAKQTNSAQYGSIH